MSIKLFSASAGSGKTYTLTLEYIKLALAGTDTRGYFRRILAVTFTIKAAEEMRSRIIEFLELIANYPYESTYPIEQKNKGLEIIQQIQIELQQDGKSFSQEELAKKAKIAVQQILQDYGLFSVMTIDSFVQRLSSSFIEELNLPNKFEVILDGNQLIHDLLDQLLERVNSLGDPNLTALLVNYARTEVQEGRSWNLLRKNLHQFLIICLDESFLKVQDTIATYSIQDFLNLEQQILQSLHLTLSELKGIATGILALVDTIHLADTDFCRGANGPVAGFRKFVNNPLIEPKKFTYYTEAVEKGKWYGGKVSPAEKIAIEGISDELSIRTQMFMDAYQSSFAKYMILNWLVKDIKKIALLSIVTDELMIYQMENSAVSISEFSKRIYDVIANDPVPFIYEKLGDRYYHILIDEFQDTSVLQWQNFMPLLENSVSSGKFNLLVGDAKQSIYKFRGGEVGLITALGTKDPQWLGSKLGDNPMDFQRFQYLLQSTKHQNLEFNYRSAKEIVTFNNQFFAFVSKHPAYQALSDLLEPIYGFQSPQIAKIPSDAFSGLVDLRVFVKPIESSLAHDEEMEWMLEHVIQQINQSLADQYAWRDIAILTRKNVHAKYLAIQLKERGIPVISSDSLLVHYSPVVSFLNSFLRLLLQPNDQFLFFELIYQYRLISNQLIEFDGAIKNQNYLNLVLSYFQGSPQEIDPSKLLKSNALALIYYFIDRFDLLNGKEGTEYMFKYLDILQEFVLQKSNDLIDFISYYELNKSNFSIACPDHMNAITITSIHKSKGLEYPVVILPFSTWTHQADGEKIWFDIAELDFEELYVEDREKITHHYGRINSKEIVGYDSMELQAKSEKDAIFLDALNMLYVATTRAKQRLHILLAKPDISAHFRSHTVFKQSIGQMLLDFATENSDLPTDNQDDDLPIYYCFQGSLAGSRKVEKKLKEAYTFEIELNATLHEVPDFRIKSSKADLFTMAEEKRRRGDLIHDFLASFSGLSNLENQLEALDDELQTELRVLLSNPSIKDLFIDEELLFVETDILCPDGTTFRPDRVISKEGKTLVIDYKTGVEKEKHRIQLSNYKNILSQMGFSNIQGLLVYLSDQRLEYV